MNHAVRSMPKKAPRPYPQRLGTFFRYLALSFWWLITLFPFAWTLLSAFKDNSQIFSHPLALPNPVVWGNFEKAWKGTQLVVTGTNSLLYASLTVFFVLLIAAPASFYCSKIARTKLLSTYFLAGIMIPIHAILTGIPIKSFS